MRIIIASKNDAKITGARKAFERYFDNVEVMGVDVESNVSKQPINQEITQGARNRVKNARLYCENNNIIADYFVAIESGLNNLFGDWVITNVAIIENANGCTSMGTSSSFPVPERFVGDIKNTDLRTVMNSIFGQDDNRHKLGGGVQMLTLGQVTRIDITEEAFVMALTRFVNKEWN